MEFQEFQKIGRLSRDMVITEKIDGTNAQIAILPKLEADQDDGGRAQQRLALADADGLVMCAGSRTQWITPERDNHGFATWVQDHADELFALGTGRHYGEWWGSGIQRRYGLTEKRFSLFNVGRWIDAHGTNGHDLQTDKQQVAPDCCHVVPVLFRGPFTTEMIGTQIERLRVLGSVAVPGFMDPEGIVAFHAATGTLFKKTLAKDDEHKSQSGRVIAPLGV